MSREEMNASATGDADGHDGTRTMDTTIDRRNYLRLAGGAAASLAALGGAGAAAGADYRTITLDRGEHRITRMGDGESFENVLIDATAGHCTHKLVANGSDWSIRNVAIKGRLTGDRAEQAFNLSVPEGGSATMENVYMGDGTVDGNWVPIFVPLRHAGTLTFRNLHIDHWPNNGLYASAPGIEQRGGQNGVIQIESCYARNNNIDGFRIGTDGSYIRDSVVHVDSDVPDVFGGKESARGIWVREGGSVTIENCDVLLEHPDTTWGVKCDDSRARVVDSEFAVPGGKGRFDGNVELQNVGSDPDPTPPDTVPMNPEEALSGGAPEPDPGPNGPGLFTISNRGQPEPATYEFSVEGTIDPTESVNRDTGDSIDGATASGRVNGGADTYRVTGSITDISVDGPVALEMDGESVTADAPNVLEVSNRGLPEPATYEFGVGGTIDPTGSVNGNDEIAGSSARGTVNRGSDVYLYGGGIDRFDNDGPVTVYVNGRETRPTALLPHYLRVRATGEQATYEFTTTGDVEPGPDFDTDGTDEVTSQRGAGRVVGEGADDFYFSGRLASFGHDGPLQLFVDGEAVDPDRFARPDNHLVVQATGSRSTYRFDVSGTLRPGPDFDNDGTDTIDGSTGSGRVVGEGADDFYFDGDLTGFTHDGALDVYVNDKQIDPDAFSYEHTLAIEGSGPRAGYELTVSDRLAEANDSLSGGDEISGTSASGAVFSGTDSFRFDGRITDLSIENPDAVSVFVDGEEIDPTTPTRHTLAIRGTGPRVGYELGVTGDLQGRNDSLSGADEVSGTSASGAVFGGTDQFAYTGELETLTLDNPDAATVLIDGEPADSSRFALPHEITISNRGLPNPATYEFSVSGALQATDSVNFDSGDSITGTDASGRVNGGADSYQYSGEITAFNADGPVDVSVDGSEVYSSS